MKKVVIVIIVVALLGIGGYALTRHDTKPTTTATTENTGGNTSASQTPADTTANSQATITYSDNGFSPRSLTVASGTTVTIKNMSSSTMQFDSDPHPAHTDDQDLNAGIVAPGKSQSFMVSKKGTFGYHNHLNASDTGTIIVR